MKYILFLLTATLLITSPASASEKPTAEEARKVITYYFEGQGSGAVLMDHVLCQEVSTAEPDKNECIDVVNPGQISKGQELYLWMSFLVPSQDKADIIITFSRKDKVRRTANVKLSGATRFRTWKKIPTGKAGQWRATVLQELEDKDLELGSFLYTVVKEAKPAQ